MRIWDHALARVMMLAPWNRWSRGATVGLAVAALVLVGIGVALFSPVLWDTCACSILQSEAPGADDTLIWRGAA
jgi:hypothetical protein